MTDGRYDKDIAKLPGMDYVFFRYGLNDRGKREDSRRTFPKTSPALIARLRHDFPHAKIIPTTIIPYMAPEVDDEINSLIREGAEAEKLPVFIFTLVTPRN